jgi:hypothetical protein
MLLYGSQYAGSLQQQQQQQQQHLCEEEQSSSSSSSQSSAGLPAVAVGLQSQGVLNGTHTQLALGLWELCHELGHAVNFILSAAELSPALSNWQQQQRRPAAATDKLDADTAGLRVYSQNHKPYHLHAAWLPLEVLELPSTLFEMFSMDAACLQVLCRHSSSSSSSSALPADLAARLAGFVRSSHYNPFLMQHTVRASASNS